MRDLKVNLVGFSPKINRPNVWENVDADKYQADGQEIIKVYLTQHDIKHRNFAIDGGMIILENETYSIADVTYDEKRPKYANCQVTKLVG